MKFGLCLSGGGARGSFHIGVIKALEEAGIKPSIVSGTSAGALIGSLYCSGLSSSEMIQLAKNTKWYHFIAPHLPSSGLIEMNFLRNILSENITHNSFESLKTPLITTATNITSGKLEYFSTGPLFEPILASCAVPVIFKPQIINENKYLDGGILMNLPASIIRSHCDYLIASNLMPIKPMKSEMLSSYGSIMGRVLELSIRQSMKLQVPLVDQMVEEESISNFSRFNLSNSIILYELGYKTGLNAMRAMELELS